MLFLKLHDVEISMWLGFWWNHNCTLNNTCSYSESEETKYSVVYVHVLGMGWVWVSQKVNSETRTQGQLVCGGDEPRSTSRALGSNR